MEIELYVKGDEQAADALDRLGTQATDARTAFSQIMDTLITGERALWVRRSGWPKLAVSTRQRKDRDPRPMYETGALEQSLTMRRAPNAVRTIRDDEMRFGTNIPYARYHQNPKGGPKRQVVKVTPATRRNIRSLILEHIMEGQSK